MGTRKKSSQVLRRDKKQKCVKGKPCGDVCIPKTSVCRQGKASQEPAVGLSYGLYDQTGETVKAKFGNREASYTFDKPNRTIRLSGGKQGKQKSVELDLKKPAVVAGLVGGYFGLRLAGALATGVVRDKVEDIKTFRQFEKDRQFWEKTGIPTPVTGAYDHHSHDLNLSLLAAEHEIKDMPYERLYIFDKSGNPIVIRGGKEGSVGLGVTDIPKIKKFDNTGAVVTHNHPGGATFSSTDIRTAGNLGLSEIRATTSTETYLLRPKGRSAFSQQTNQRLLRAYEPMQARIVTKHKRELFKKELPFKANPSKATKKLLYYSTIGKRTLNQELLRSIEFEAHQGLADLINARFKDDFEYRRVPRYTTPTREKAFLRRDSAFRPAAEGLGTSRSLELYQAVESAISGVYGEIDGLPSLHQNEAGTLSGTFRDGHQLYDYAIAPNGILSYVESTRRDAYLVGFSIDSGKAKRQDASTARKPKKCLQGKPCKNTCIAKGVMCRVQLTPKAVMALRQVTAAIGTHPSDKNVVRSPTLPLGSAATAMSAAAAFALGAGIIANNRLSRDNPEADVTAKKSNSQIIDNRSPRDDLEDSFHAIVSVYQDALNASGVRELYPATITNIERVVGRKNDTIAQKKVVESLGGTIMMAHVDSEKEKHSSSLKRNLSQSGRAAATERLGYIGKLLDDPTRSQDFKFALSKFSKDVNPPPNPEELAALRYYTDSKGYQEMNRTLRGQVDGLQTWLKTEHNDRRSRSQIQSDASRDIKMVTSALNALPNHQGKVYRGLTLPENVIPDVGQSWKEKGFTSTTKNAFTRYPGNVAMVIESKTGKDITKYEKYKNDEVLFKPSTSFRVTEKRKVKKFGKEFWLIKMQQD